MRSLNTRLGSGLIVALLLVFAVQWLLVSLIIRHVTEEYIATRMTRDVEQLLAALTFDAAGNPLLAEQPAGLYNSGPFSGQYFQVSTGDQVLRSESIWDETLAVSAVTVGETARQRLSGPLDQALLALSMGFQKQGHNITITVAEDLSAVDAGIDTFQRLYLLFSLGLMVLLLLVQWWIVRRSLSALTTTRLDLERITRGESETLPEDVPAEIRPLVSEINLLLGLLARRLDRTRTAIGNLAHKLKTPLSLLSQLEDEPAMEQHPRFRQRLRLQVTAMADSLERELGRARLAGDSKSGRRFVPRDDIDSLVSTMKRVYQDKQLIIEQDFQTEANWPADQEDMLELFGNLLDNACKWANTTVRISIGTDHIAVIDDDGPGCPPDLMESLRSRGRRLDETVDGHGLGLSIAHDIVTFYKGHLDFAGSPDLGGMRVKVNLPAL